MKKFNRLAGIVALQISAMGLMISPAFANRADTDSSASIRQEQRSNIIQVKGILSLEQGTLKIKEAATGRTYNLTGMHNGQNTAMAAFVQGTKNVAISGNMTGENTIEVSQVTDN